MPAGVGALPNLFDDLRHEWSDRLASGSWRGFNRGFDRLASGYAWSVGGIVRRKFLFMLLYAGLLAATVWIVNHVPRGFIPTLDQGYAIVVIQLQDGASLSRTDQVTKRASEIARETPVLPRRSWAVSYSGCTVS